MPSSRSPGPPATPPPQGLPTRIGGWGGAEAQAAWMAAEGIGAVIDATHPFAARIGPRTAALCAAAGHALSAPPAPRLDAQAPDDRWTRLAALEAVAGAIPPEAALFLATGRQSLAALCRRSPGAGSGCASSIRRRDRSPGRTAPGWSGRPPFTEADEIALFRRLRLGWLVAKDAGGAGGWPKLAAARALGLPVALMSRPPPPQGVTVVASVEAALDWLAAL